MWFLFAFALGGAFVLSSIPKPETRPADSVAELNVPVTEEGKDIGVLFGTRDFEDFNVTWWGDLSTEPVKKKGGKK